MRAAQRCARSAGKRAFCLLLGRRTRADLPLALPRCDRPRPERDVLLLGPAHHAGATLHINGGNQALCDYVQIKFGRAPIWQAREFSLPRDRFIAHCKAALPDGIRLENGTDDSLPLCHEIAKNALPDASLQPLIQCAWDDCTPDQLLLLFYGETPVMTASPSLHCCPNIRGVVGDFFCFALPWNACLSPARPNAMSPPQKAPPSRSICCISSSLTKPATRRFSCSKFLHQKTHPLDFSGCVFDFTVPWFRPYGRFLGARGSGPRFSAAPLRCCRWDARRPDPVPPTAPGR